MPSCNPVRVWWWSWDRWLEPMIWTLQLVISMLAPLNLIFKTGVRPSRRTSGTSTKAGKNRKKGKRNRGDTGQEGRTMRRESINVHIYKVPLFFKIMSTMKSCITEIVDWITKKAGNIIRSSRIQTAIRVIIHSYKMPLFTEGMFNMKSFQIAHKDESLVHSNKFQTVVRLILPSGPAKLKQCEITDVKRWRTKTNDFRQIAAVGLLESVWPGDKVLLGMCVCKWMRQELPKRVNDVSIHVWRGMNKKDGDLAKCFRRLANNNVTILWRGQSDLLIFGMARAIHGVSPACLYADNFRLLSEPSNKGFGKALMHLDLAWSTLGSKGAEKLYLVLKGSKSLRHLSLRSTKLGNAGTTSVAALLSNCKELSFLDLGWNAIGDSGAVSLGHLFAMGHFSRFAHLDLSGNWLEPFGVGRLVAGIEKCTALQHLDLSHNMLGDDGASRVGTMMGRSSCISSILLMGNRIGRMGAENLAEGAGRAAALTHLDLAGNRIGDWHRTPAGDPRTVEPFLKGLTRSTTLSSLGLRRNKIEPEAMPSLAEMLRKCPSITQLDLAHNHIGPDGAAVVGKMLADCTQLQHLDLEGGGLGQIMEGGAMLLGRAATHPSNGPVVGTLVCLSLREINLRSQKIGDAGIQAVAAALSLCRGLQGLNMACNHIGNNGAAAVAATLPQWPQLLRLDMSENTVGNAGAWAMVRLLRECPLLQFFNIGGNAVGSRALEALVSISPGKTMVVH